MFAHCFDKCLIVWVSIAFWFPFYHLNYFWNNNARIQIQGGTSVIPVSIRGRPASVDVDPQNVTFSDVQQIIGSTSTGQTITRKITNQSEVLVILE